MAVGSTDARKVGRCLLCRSPFDDYSPRCRCSQCRLLVLVCGDCRERPEPAAYVCELCQDAKTESRAALENESGGELTNRKLDAASGLGSKSGDVSVEHGPATESVRSVVTIPPDRRNGEADGQDGRVLGSSSENGTDPFADGASVRTGSHWEEALSGGLTPRRRLRVLCLHGFRQTGRGLKGRLAAFQRKLGDLLELVFVDGPFQLPCVYYSGGLDGGEGGDQTGSGEGAKSTDRSVLGAAGFEDKGSEEATCERTREGVRAERGAEGGVRDRGVSPRVERVSRGGECSVGEAADCTDAATFGSGVGMPGSAESQKQAPGGPFPKFAWLVSPEQLREIRRSVESSGKNGESAVRGHPGGDAHAKECGETATVELRLEESAAWKGEAPGEVKEASRGAGGADWKPASARFGPLQYLTQTAGWETSLAHLRRIVSEQGPFDGVLGFSQGAAVAAALCRYSTTAKALGDENAFAFRFAVLCSGFLSPAEGRQEANRHLIDLPSLHVFGSLKGNDRQIEVAESERLAERFEPRHRVVVRHSAGHIIPISKSHVNQYKSFFLKTF